MVLGAWCLSASAAETNALLSTWFAAQTNIQTWSADFLQTRTLKSLTQPLTATGHVWFAAPNRFRWELGNPTQTIAVRGADEMLASACVRITDTVSRANGSLQKDVEQAVRTYLYGETRRQPMVFVTVTRV